MEKYKIIVEKTSTGYSAYSHDVLGVVSTGKNWENVKQNFSEAFQFHLDGLKEDGEEIPQDYKLEFGLDLAQFFEHYSIFNVSALAKYLEINPQLLHQYKEGHKNVSEKTSVKILKGVHRFAEELLSSV